MSKYDYIISGAGCAGLSLLNQLAKSLNRHKNILLLDRKSSISNDRTWCYWSKSTPYYPDINFKSWSKVNFTLGHESKVENLYPWKYHCIRGIDFYKLSKSYWGRFDHLDFKKSDVLGVQEKSDHLEVITDVGSFTSDFVFNSIPRQNISQKEGIIYTKQHFYGLFVETEDAVFDDSCVTLMNFQPHIYDGAGFFYILPFEKNQALIEFTVFSEDTWQTEEYLLYINKFIKDYLQVSSFKITDTEKGVIPMTDYMFPKKIGTRQMQIGTLGGMTKPTTGYTFRNIQEESKMIVNNLEKYQHPFYNYKFSGRFRFYDRILLNIIKQNPEDAPIIFRDLFMNNSFKRVFKFLNEDTNLLDEAKLFMGLPWNTFIGSLLNLYFVKQKDYDWSTSP